jgi:hypothetical protein
MKVSTQKLATGTLQQTGWLVQASQNSGRHVQAISVLQTKAYWYETFNGLQPWVNQPYFDKRWGNGRSPNRNKHGRNRGLAKIKVRGASLILPLLFTTHQRSVTATLPPGKTRVKPRRATRMSLATVKPDGRTSPLIVRKVTSRKPRKFDGWRRRWLSGRSVNLSG